MDFEGAMLARWRSLQSDWDTLEGGYGLASTSYRLSWEELDEPDFRGLRDWRESIGRCQSELVAKSVQSNW